MYQALWEEHYQLQHVSKSAKGGTRDLALDEGICLLEPGFKSLMRDLST
jgi:hypothetical protein